MLRSQAFGSLDLRAGQRSIILWTTTPKTVDLGTALGRSPRRLWPPTLELLIARQRPQVVSASPDLINGPFVLNCRNCSELQTMPFGEEYQAVLI